MWDPEEGKWKGKSPKESSNEDHPGPVWAVRNMKDPDPLEVHHLARFFLPEEILKIFPDISGNLFAEGR